MATDGDSLQSQKALAFHSATIAAWIETRMERDKTLLNLATAGIGLLVALLTTQTAVSVLQFWLSLLAGLCFLGTVASAVWIFHRNGDYLKGVADGTATKNDPLLVKLDVVLVVTFVLGVLVTCAIAITTGFSKLP